MRAKPIEIKKEVNVLKIDPKEVDRYWSLVDFMVREGIKYDDDWVTVEEFKDFCKDGSLQLFMMFGSDDGLKHKVFGVFVTRIMVLPKFKQVEVVLLKGEQRELWQDEAAAMIEHLAVQEDCKRIAVFARKGWERFLNGKGWKTRRYLYTKEIK
jgi:hypothetical protein